MTKTKCAKCEFLRTVMLAILLGGGAGFATLRAGLGREASMIATFFAALLPVLWWVRRNRTKV